MNHILNYNNFVNEKYEYLNEGVNLEPYKKIQDNVIKDMKIQFNFIISFGTCCRAFYPVVDGLLKNNPQFQVTTEMVVYLTIAALSILFNENKEKIQIILNKLKEEKCDQYLKDVIKSIKAVKEIFASIAGSFGVVINFISDMFGYTALLIPFFDILSKIIHHQNITTENLIGVGVCVAAGSLTFMAKNLLIFLTNQLKEKFKSFGFSKKDIPETIPVKVKNDLN